MTPKQVEQILAVLHNQETECEGLLRQAKVAKMLDINRATVWRMVKDGTLHPVELRPGLWRYPVQEVLALSNPGKKATTSHRRNN